MTLLSQTSLDPSLRAQLKEQFRQQPTQHVQIDNFLRPEVAESVSNFLSNEAEYASVYGLKSVANHDADETVWSAAPDSDRLFFNEMLVGSTKRISKSLHNFIKLREYFASSEFCEFASAITGLVLPSAFDARVHLFREGHYLRPHHDRTKNRRVAYILYLAPTWEASFGGALAITGENGQITKIVPRYNSLLLFDVYSQKEHEIQPVLPASEGKPRLTMSAWLNSGPKT